MNYKSIFKRIISIITVPTTSWEELSAETGNTEKEDFRFFYFLLIANMVSSFAGGLLYGDSPFVSAIIKSIVTGVAFFGGFWGIYYIFTDILCKRFKITVSKAKTVRLIIYSMTLSFSLSILTALLPGLFFLKIINIYTLYIVWEGVSKLIPLEENERSNFVLLLSAVIVLFPFVISQLLLFSIPIAKL